ncbi:hypothetical protein H4R20_005311 [Coemansia guatemalensis]|uniref:DUF3752 domain-containing protein n=1 Tax=Coemansia guatemalensis TaxID=2761395 RepID=A0A9W8LRZ1_9FUNG|nr:hypothetical protein H4R20_005311 [Coemansia guatemalensis]
MGGGGIGPQIPPEVAARLGIRVGSGNDGTKEEKNGAEQPSPKRNVIGPSMPPSLTSLGKDSPAKPSTDDDAENSSDSEAVGPSTELAGYSEKQAQQQTIDKLDAQMEHNSSGGGGTADKHGGREEWMLVPPSKRGAGGKATDDGIFDESWTLTPEQRRERAAQQAKAARKQQPEETAASRRQQEEDQDKAQWVDEFNRSQRPKSLMEMHLETKHKSRRSKRTNNSTRPQEQDDAWKRQRFDRERDLATEQKSNRRQHHAVLDAMGTLTDKYAPGKAISCEGEEEDIHHSGKDWDYILLVVEERTHPEEDTQAAEENIQAPGEDIQAAEAGIGPDDIRS